MAGVAFYSDGWRLLRQLELTVNHSVVLFKVKTVSDPLQLIPRPVRRPDYDDDEEDEDDQISCLEGRQIVRDRAYRHVRTINCSSSVYKYRALKRGKSWSVRVDS